MAIKNIICKGVGFVTGTDGITWMPMHGFGPPRAGPVTFQQLRGQRYRIARAVVGPRWPIRSRSIYRVPDIPDAPFERRVWRDRVLDVYWRLDFTAVPPVVTLAPDYPYIPVDGWTIPGGQVYITNGTIAVSTTTLTGTFSPPQEAPFLLSIVAGALVHVLT